jgi:copper resistance protein C
MRILTPVTAALLALIVSISAHAHAVLDRAEPRVGSTIQTAPSEVVLFFDLNLEPAFSSIEVSDAKGTRVDLGKTSVSASTMRVRLKPLTPGSYHVRWRVLSTDTHKTEGSFTFHVGQ